MTLQTQEGLFSINTANGNVTLSKQLDYEKERFYQLEIMAIVSLKFHVNPAVYLLPISFWLKNVPFEKCQSARFLYQDGGFLNSTTDLIINVEDVQDTAPFFLNLPYIDSVPEDVPVVRT